MKNTQFYGNRIKLLISVWILVGSLFIGINVYAFMSILEDPFPEPSREVKTARSKYGMFLEMTAHISNAVDTNTWDIFKQRFSNGHKIDRSSSQKKLQAKNQISLPDHLPELTGILTIYTDDLDTVYLAVLNGKTLREQEKINGFKLHNITEDRIILERNGHKWVINAPNIKYSVSHHQ